MYLIQLLLMFCDNHDGHLDGDPRDTLVARFGGLISVFPRPGRGRKTARTPSAMR
jgi:hypothetical protein